MNKIPRDVEEKLEAYLAGRLGKREQAEMKKAIAANPDYRDYLDFLKMVRQEGKEGGKIKVPPRQAGETVRRVKALLFKEIVPSKKARRFTKWGLGIAAVGLLVLAVQQFESVSGGKTVQLVGDKVVYTEGEWVHWPKSNLGAVICGIYQGRRLDVYVADIHSGKKRLVKRFRHRAYVSWLDKRNYSEVMGEYAAEGRFIPNDLVFVDSCRMVFVKHDRLVLHDINTGEDLAEHILPTGTDPWGVWLAADGDLLSVAYNTYNDRIEEQNVAFLRLAGNKFEDVAGRKVSKLGKCEQHDAVLAGAKHVHNSTCRKTGDISVLFYDMTLAGNNLYFHESEKGLKETTRHLRELRLEADGSVTSRRINGALSLRRHFAATDGLIANTRNKVYMRQGDAWRLLRDYSGEKNVHIAAAHDLGGSSIVVFKQTSIASNWLVIDLASGRERDITQLFGPQDSGWPMNSVLVVASDTPRLVNEDYFYNFKEIRVIDPSFNTILRTIKVD